MLRDAVWGDLELEPELVALLDTPELQRLRGVRQLGTAHLVYPSANHTRFEHGLGTCHLAGRILDALARAGQALDPRLRLAIRAAALIHDVGHVPCGHTFEDERRIFPRHDHPARTRWFLGDTALGEALRQAGLHGEVERILTGDPAGSALGRDVVAGTVCADLLDYLARDALFTGIRRGWDERLLRYFACTGSEAGRLVLRLHKRGLPREDALSEVVHLLRLRYTLSERVYFHHAKVASGALVAKMVERASAQGPGAALRLEDLFGLGDEGLLLLLERAHAPRDPVIARLLADLRARRLPRRAYVLTRRVGEPLQGELVRRLHADRTAREAEEAALEAELGLAPGSVILHCPSPDMALKEADVLVDTGGGEPRPLQALGLAEVAVLAERHRDLWRFYAFSGGEQPLATRQALARACQARFGAPNELGEPGS
mgnify:CR=1 FL=1